MNQDAYCNMIDKFRANKHIEKFIPFANSLLTKLVYTIFPLFMIYLFIRKDERFVRILFTTAISFLLVSIFRKIFDRERPYEKYGVTPIIPKDKKGNSFPSRHVFSAFVIAVSCLYVNIALGIVMLIVSAFIAVLRVIGGVHFIADVVAGAVIGIVAGIIGLYMR